MTAKTKDRARPKSAVAKWLTIGGVAVAVVLAGLAMSRHLWIDVLIKRGAVAAAARRLADLPGDGKLHVVVVGSGSPSVDPDRVQACVAVFTDHEFLLFDTGGAAAYRLDLLGLPVSRLGAVFFTHLHSDHIADLPLVANISWRHGRKLPLVVYGPAGVEAVVRGFNQAHRPDLEFRRQNTRDHTAPLEIALPLAHVIATPGSGERSLVYQGADGMEVYAFEVDHQPVKPALGFRIEYKGLVVVISGDTRRCLNVARHAQNADVLIHEAFNKNLVNRMLTLAAEEIAASPQGAILTSEARDVQHYHSSPEDAADIAAQAKVKTLVFTHIIPPLGGGLARALVTEPLFLDGVDRRFDGKVIIAEDGTHLALEPPRLAKERQ